jgi:tRNA (guanine37-N1)-methyltransferase
MRVGIVTLFPELFDPFTRTSFVGRAIESNSLVIHLEPLRDHGLGNHRSVDDTPYGGGSGMVMRVDCVVTAMEQAEATLTDGQRAHRILLTPQGAPLVQATAARLSALPSLVLVCGRYEGFDERVREFVDEELSIGDFVLTGGEVAAMAVLEACVRLLPGVLGNAASPDEESFSAGWGGILEYPHYTRPLCYRDREVPEVLRSGDHARIAEWRRDQALDRTRRRRPDLLTKPRSGSGPESS